MSDSRRAFLRFLAASPLLPAQETARPVIDNAKDALNVFELEAAARKALPPAHWGYLAGGVDDDRTIAANREGFQRLQIRTRRLVDVSQIDTRVELFGTTWDSPILLAPVGNMNAFHPDSEIVVARAAANRRTLQILSTAATSPVEAVVKARGGPIWFQLYASSDWDITRKLVVRAEAAGCPVIALTVDRPGPRNPETELRFKRLDSRTCTACHAPNGFFKRKPMFEGLDMTESKFRFAAMNWDFVRRLRDLVKVKLILKGLEAREDAALAVEAGIDGIIVSNHGGRGEDSGRGTIEALPEVVEAVRGRIPVLLDGGIRRGTDVFKALALGARAIAIGRPYIWGLSAFGQPGVERVIEIFHRELDYIMRAAGTTSLSGIGAGFVTRR
ncbi:MAG: alpha-hydroxy acid oxidase [Bryobacteraceae bacterium]